MQFQSIFQAAGDRNVFQCLFESGFQFLQFADEALSVRAGLQGRFEILTLIARIAVGALIEFLVIHVSLTLLLGCRGITGYVGYQGVAQFATGPEQPRHHCIAIKIENVGNFFPAEPTNDLKQ